MLHYCLDNVTKPEDKIDEEAPVVPEPAAQNINNANNNDKKDEEDKKDEKKDEKNNYYQ